MSKTHFGFQEIAWSEKTDRIRNLFTGVSSRYDLMNDIMSLGAHRCWKTDAVLALPLKERDVVLDVAGGTGDMSFKILDTYPHLNLSLTVCDLTPDMMQKGRERALNKAYTEEISWVCGDAQALPFADKSVDVYVIAFGLRNVTDIDQTLQEAHRVLKPGGHFACLELSHVDHPMLQKAYDFYSFSLIPWLGEHIARDRSSYQYLVESIRRFPSKENLAVRLRSTGFDAVHYTSYWQGISCLHQATKKQPYFQKDHS